MFLQPVRLREVDIAHITAVAPGGSEHFDLLSPLTLRPQLLHTVAGDLAGRAGELLSWLGQTLLHKQIPRLLVFLPYTKQSQNIIKFKGRKLQTAHDLSWGRLLSRGLLS